MRASSRRLDVSPEPRAQRSVGWCGGRAAQNWRGGTRVSELVVFRGLGAGSQNYGLGTVVGNSAS